MKRKRTTGPYPDESLRGVLKRADSGLFEGLEKNWDKGKQTLLDYLTEEDFTSGFVIN